MATFSRCLTVAMLGQALLLGGCGAKETSEQHEGTAEQREALTFTQNGNLVSMEAEHFTTNTPQGGHSWTEQSAAAAAGGSQMAATPDNGAANNTGYAQNSPRLNFGVSFVQAGTYQVWIRGRAGGSNAADSDSVHVGLNGQAVASADRISSFTGSFGWSRATMDGANATLGVPSAGQHTVNVWMREDGFIVDKIVLTLDANYTPTGTGPAETPATQPTCSDGQQNGNETGVDCGGSCPPCNPGGPTSYWVEAEQATRSGNPTWSQQNDGAAASGQYLLPPSGSSPNSPGSARATYSFTVGSGSYKLWARVLAPNADDDSLWVSMDGGAFVKWNSIPNSASYAWDDLHNSDMNSQPVVYTLTAGTHTLVVANREDGIRVDKLYLTAQGDVPSGLGGSNGTCSDGMQNQGETGVDCGGPCPACPVCSDGQTRVGTTPCGLNGRGDLQQLCAGGAWQDTATCIDPDVCTDASTRPGGTPCGFNGRGALDEVCVLGQWQDSAVCVDPDECADDSTRVGTTPCGLNGRGGLEELCVLGAWSETSTCVDPDECTDDDTRDTANACGFNSRGVLTELCVLGGWQDESCADPDECTDDDTRAGSTPCGDGGTFDQLCVVGQWQDTSSCTEPDRCDDGQQNGNETGVDCGGECPPCAVTAVWLEAESATRSGNPGFTIASDANAAGGQYLSPPAGSSANSPGSARATWSVTVEAGVYRLWGRVITPNADDDSFWVSVDSGAFVKWNSIPASSSWAWDDVHNSDAGGAVMSYTLAAGTHTLVVANREDGARLDKLYLTANGDVPTGQGGDVATCSDGMQNQGETGIDCGGPCPPCAVCGDGTCSALETCTSCPSDCGTCPATGLDERPPNPTCLAPPPIASGLTLTNQWGSATFTNPVQVVQPPGDNSRFIVVQRAGTARGIPANATSGSQAYNFLQLGNVVTASNGGFLSLAFHPNWQSNRYAYVVYTTNNLMQRVSRFQSTDGGQTLNAGTEQVVLQFQHQTEFNHNGGQVAFGTDGFLYLSTGDDAYLDYQRARHAATTNNFFGKILRIDVNSGSPYAIPPSNPFAGGGGLPEVYAYGLRNPWRFSVDRLTGELWVGDAGEDTWEEANVIQSGGFYGWPYYEGDSCFSGNATDCSTPYQSPEHAYTSGAASISGGFVYRGSAIPSLYGKYVYGDYVSGAVSVYDETTGNATAVPGSTSGGAISAFGEDNQGELYVVRYSTGRVQKILPQGGGGPADFPALLTDTGCFDPTDPTEVVSGVIPYSIAHPFWSDGVEKERYLAIPDGTQISIGTGGDWELPPGSVTIKHFRHQGLLFETRFFVRHQNGSYSGYSYQWNTAQTQAFLVPPGGASVSLPGLDWSYPTRSECFACHTPAANFSLGLETRQINVDGHYPTTGRTANQLLTLDTIDMLTGDTSSMAPFAAIDDFGVPVDQRARAYLHVNCSSCHRPGGPGGGPWDSRFDTPFADMKLCNQPATLGNLGLPNGVLLSPGDHMSSIAWLRMSERDVPYAMPPLASGVVDAAGAALLQEWIDGITSCPAPPVLPCNDPNNRVTNCDFSAGTSSWTLRQNGGGSGSATVTGGQLRLSVSNPGTENWHVQEVQILGALTAGSYQFSFDGRADSPRQIVINVGEEGDDYSPFCETPLNLTTTMQRYTVNCGAIAADNNVKLDFNVGQSSTAAVNLDNVYFGPPR